MFDGSITVHWAFALPAPKSRQNRTRGRINFNSFIRISLDFRDHASDYFHSDIEQKQREGYQGKQSDEQTYDYCP